MSDAKSSLASDAKPGAGECDAAAGFGKGDAVQNGGCQSKESEEEREEPDLAEHCRCIAKGAAASGVLYGAVRLLVPSSRAEDVVDMLHSLYTTSVALRGVGSMKPHPLHICALPPHLAHARGPVVRMFCYSLGYFFADVCKISVDVLIRGKYPNLWAGRLAHHVVQLGANAPGIFGRGRTDACRLAYRSVLCRAYVAELSSIFLRLSNLLRDGSSPAARVAVNWTLVATFFGSRIVNFAIAIAMFLKARPVLAPQIFKLGGVVQTGGYALSAVWFTKIVKIALSTQLSVPSVEC